jgi:hypothetical protein
MLVGTFAFANNAKEVTTVNFEETVELIKSLKSTDFSDNMKIENNLDIFGTCTITIEGYNQDGELVHYHQFSLPADSAYHCSQLAAAFRRVLQ